MATSTMIQAIVQKVAMTRLSVLICPDHTPRRGEVFDLTGPVSFRLLERRALMKTSPDQSEL